MFKRLSVNRVMVAATLLSMWVIFMLIEQFTAFQLDNLLFERTYLDFTGDEVRFSWSALVDYVLSIRRDDNWRLGNILAPLTTLFCPKWLFSALVSGAFTFTAWAVARIVSGKGDDFTALTLTWASMVVFLPYSHTLFIGDYALNYIVAGALSLIFILLLASGKWRRGWRAVAVMGLAPVVAWWHEGFALPVVAGLMCYALSRKGRVPWAVYAAGGVLGVVALGVALCPGMMSRISGREAGHAALLHDAVRSGIYNCLTLLLAAAVTIGLLLPRLRGSLRRMLHDGWFCFFAGSAFAALLLSVGTSYSARTAYWPQICSMVAFGRWFYPEMERRAGAGSRFAAGVVALCLCMVQGLATLPWVWRVWKVHCEAMEEALASPRHTACVDVIYPEDVPWYCRDMPASIEFIETFNYRCLNDRYFKLRSTMAVVPRVLGEELQGLSCDTVSVDPVVCRAGDALYGARIPTGHGSENITCDITLTDGRVLRGHGAVIIDFIDRDWRRLTYIKPFGIKGAQVAGISLSR